MQDLLTINKVEMVAHGHGEKEYVDDEVITKEIPIFLNPICPRGEGGGCLAPLSRICMQNKRVVKNLLFLSYEFGKGQYTFYHVKFVGNTTIS